MTTTRTVLPANDTEARLQGLRWANRHAEANHLGCTATQASMIECDRQTATVENILRK